MSWDVVVFSSKQKIGSFEEIDEELLVPIDFNAVLEKHFKKIAVDSNHREITGSGYAIGYFTDAGPVSNKIFNLFGESALFELIRAAKINGWQIFDTGNGEMLDLENPEKNGYNEFQQYLQHVLKNEAK